MITVPKKINGKRDVGLTKIRQIHGNYGRRGMRSFRKEAGDLRNRAPSSHADGLEDVDSVQSGGDHHAGNLRMPMNLFNLFLSHVNEQELRRDLVQRVFFHFRR